jgi:arylsulfatase A-like enzyme
VGFPVPERLNERVATLAERLRERGWATAAFTEGGYAEPGFGLEQGFELYPPPPGDHGTAVSERSRRLADNLERALAWLDEERAPFFLFFHTYEPHSPYRPPPEDARHLHPGYDEQAEHARLLAVLDEWNRERRIEPAGMALVARHWFHCAVGEFVRRAGASGPVLHGRELMERLRAHGFVWEELHRDRQWLEWTRDLYDADVLYTDRMLARLFDALDAPGRAENTIVVVLSDHGEGLGDHGELGHGAVFFEEILRVVLMLRAPGAGPTRRVDAVVSTLDVLPTLLELAGVGVRGEGGDGLDRRATPQGRSLVPLLRGHAPERPAFSQARRAPGAERAVASVRFGPWRLIRDEAAGTTQLFELTRDPGEMHDVSAAHPDVAAHLGAMLARRRALDRRVAEQLATGAGLHSDAGARLVHELEALGYVTGAPATEAPAPAGSPAPRERDPRSH